MTVFCSHCGTKLENSMKFCYNCGNPPKGASSSAATRTPKVEYKEVIFKKDQLGTIKADFPYDQTEHAANAAQPRILELLKPYFDKGWQLDGTIRTACIFHWEDTYFSNYRLHEAKVRLIRHS